MRFRSGKYRSRGMVVEAASRVILPNRQQHTEKGLRVQFEGHVFDSEAAQRLLHWTDEERETVERYLLNHSDFNRQGGIYLDDGQEMPLWAQDKGLDGSETSTCMFVDMEGDASIPCGATPVEGELYCEKHLGFVKDVTETKTTKRERVPATAG